MFNLRFLFIPKQRRKELDDLARLLAVAIYTDYKVKKDEVDEARHLIDEDDSLDGSEKEYVKKKIEELLQLYPNQNWKFLHDRDEVFDTIIKTNNIKYAKYAIDIFEADHEISQEESVIIEKIKLIIEAWDYIQKYYESLKKRNRPE